jgi:hypothetical protein
MSQPTTNNTQPTTAPAATENAENNLTNEVQQGQQQHRVQIHNTEPLADTTPKVDDSAQAFLDKQSLLLTTTVEPAFLSPTIIYVPVRFGELFTRVNYAIKTTYVNWNDLRDLIPGTATEITTLIENHCDTLAACFVISVYTRLRAVHGQFAPNASQRYRSRPPIDTYTELPAGLIHLANQFGATKPVDVPGNCIYLHHWTEDNKNTFGLPDIAYLNPPRIQGITRLLRSSKVKFDKVQRTQEFRTAWDTLLLKPQNLGFIALTTMPIENYNLPRDIFLQVTLNRNSHVIGETVFPENSPPAVYNYAMKLSRAEHSSPISEIATALTSTATLPKKRKLSAVTNISQIPISECAPHLFEQNMHPSGVSVSMTSSTSVYGDKPIMTVFGRGTDDDLFPLNVVHRDLNSQYICEYWHSLFTSGP